MLWKYANTSFAFKTRPTFAILSRATHTMEFDRRLLTFDYLIITFFSADFFQSENIIKLILKASMLWGGKLRFECDSLKISQVNRQQKFSCSWLELCLTSWTCFWINLKIILLLPQSHDAIKLFRFFLKFAILCLTLKLTEKCLVIPSLRTQKNAFFTFARFLIFALISWVSSADHQKQIVVFNLSLQCSSIYAQKSIWVG